MEMTREETITLYIALQAHGVEIEYYSELDDDWSTWPYDYFPGSKYHYRIKGRWKDAYQKAYDNGLTFEVLKPDGTWRRNLSSPRNYIFGMLPQKCYRIAKPQVAENV